MSDSRVMAVTVLPDAFAARVRDALRNLAAQQLIQRLWKKDATLWSDSACDWPKITNRLGWLSITSVMEAQIPMIQAAAQAIRQDGLTHALLLGMGGSGLFPEVCRATFGVAPGGLDLVLLDSTDPTLIKQTQQQLPLAKTLIILSSKSGTTTETNALGDYFFEQLRGLGGEPGRQCVAITDVGTPLEALAMSRQFRQVFLHGPQTGQDVGGRFSALTYFGLVPAALLGVDLQQLLSRAQAMLAACGPHADVSANPAAQLAVALTEGLGLGRDKLTLLCPPRLARLGVWVEQLVAESTGKQDKGLIPVDAEPLRNPASYSADRVFVELQLEGAIDQRVAGHVEVLVEHGHPVIRLRWRDEYDLGGEVARWFMATALAASLMRLNPFDEPNVQESKDRTKALLERYTQDKRLPHDEPLLIDEGIAVFGDRSVANVRGLEEALRSFLRQARAGDYLALLSFLPRTPDLDALVEALRARLADVVPVATTLGFGPRYLHSTGQLHKGGPDRGLFLFLTADDPVDLPVPDRPYTFSILKHAQALGDLQALQERQRRILRLDLGHPPQPAMSRLLKAVGIMATDGKR